MSASIPQSLSSLTGELSYSMVQEYTLIGKTLGNRYRVLREIGSGGMAWVYLAEDIKENELVAVKVLYPQFGEDLSYIQRFNREAKLASTLTDPHIVRVLDYGADRDIYYLVMEYIEGRNLREVLTEQGPFPWRNALEIVDQLATALEHAYPHGVVHRDIKPQNMMLTDTGLLKVLDFGIARVPTLPSLTQSGFIGSPYYVSPEQAMGEEIDIRSDIYSSGIVLYELLSGKIPFDAKSPWSIISQHITNEPPKIELPNDEVPDQVQNLLNRMIAKRPEDRFTTPTALRRAIIAILAGQNMPENALDTQPVAPDQDAMAEGLYHRALKAIEGEEWARAFDLLTQTLQLKPEYPEASEKLALAERKTFLISVYTAAKRAMQHQRWEDAVNNLNGVIELDPEYEDAAALLHEARRKLEEEDARQYILTRYNEGLAHFEAERWPEAIIAFHEVQRLAPRYERVEALLAEAERYNNPNFLQRLSQVVKNYVPRDTWWRWGMITGGIVIIVLLFLSFSNGYPVAGNDDAKQQLKALYEQAQQAIENNHKDQAIALLDQILTEDPDYADAATLKRELLVTPTPTPQPTPTAVPVVATPEVDPLAEAIETAQKSVETEQWSEAVDTLNEVRQIDPEYEQARVASLFCDAYVGRGLEYLANINSQAQDEVEIVKTALADFEAGAAECPRRTDLRDQADRAGAYLSALDTSKNDYDTLIQILTPIVAADPDYADGKAKNLLYTAHLERGKARQEATEIVMALSDYEAALALNVDDTSEAQIQRAELFLALSQEVGSNQPTPEAVETVPANNDNIATPVAEPTPEPARIRFDRPEVISPENDTLFAGRFVEVILEWTPVGELAEDEYYDVTVMHIFADEPAYWGLATQETSVQLVGADIGVGQAGGDRFYWWVTVRKANSAPSPDSIDLPVSETSEVRTFIWTP
jgi:tetratricopeptide (TPR) repeat protein/predicted Ser/Thr protein kinase